MKSLEQQLQEKEAELRDLRKKVGATSLSQELSESGLPAAAQDRIRKKFLATGKADGVKEAIVEEREYLRQVRASKRSEPTASTQKVDLVESYQRMGLSKREAELAAGVEDSVKTFNESEEKLYEATRSLGLSELEAEHFVDGSRRTSW